MKNKKLVYAIIGVIAVALIAFAITYAYWQITKTQTGENKITTACLDISLEGKDDITLTNQYPLSDDEGKKLTPYEFTITNNCNSAVDYQIALEATGDSTTALQASSIKVMLDDNTTLLNSNDMLTPTVSGAYAAYKLGTGTLAATGSDNSSATHTLRLWIDESAPVSEVNKTFTSKISVTVGEGIEKSPIQEGSLAYSILNIVGGAQNITTLSNFTSTETDDTGIYKTPDDQGTSYYYHGNINNNYVQFGTWSEAITLIDEDSGKRHNIEANSPMYWRIVRINGDGTIRLIYDGTSLAENDTSHNIAVAYSDYDSNTNGYFVEEDNNLGYTHRETKTNSIAKEAVDAWYEANLKTHYETYIADNIFCNDLEIIEKNQNSGSYSDPDTGELLYDIYYGAYNRLGYGTKGMPKLTCTRNEDRYSVSESIGNGLLSYPVGLVTADELAMAGLGKTNQKTYFSQGEEHLSVGEGLSAIFWTMTPAGHWYDAPYNPFIYFGSSTRIGYSGLDIPYSGCSIRPVINLKADVEFTGTGTIDNPYVIKTN